MTTPMRAAPRDRAAWPTKSLVRKRGVYIEGRKTSVSLEDAFWQSLHEIAARRATSVGALVRDIARTNTSPNLSSALRLFVLAEFQARAGARESSHAVG